MGSIDLLDFFAHSGAGFSGEAMPTGGPVGTKLVHFQLESYATGQYQIILFDEINGHMCFTTRPAAESAGERSAGQDLAHTGEHVYDNSVFKWMMLFPGQLHIDDSLADPKDDDGFCKLSKCS